MDGNEDTSLAQGLTGLSIRETVEGLFQSEARFGNWGPRNGSIDFLYFDRKKLDFGKKVEIKIDRDSIMEGRISALEAEFSEGKPPEIAILLEDRLQDLRMTRRTRSFENVSDADVCRKIAGDYSLQPKIDAQGPTYKFLAQVNQSDLAFVRERALAIDAEVWISSSTTLNVQSRQKRNGGTLKMAYGGDLREFTAAADLANQHTGVIVSGWDVSGKSAIKHESGDSAVQSELNGDSSGASILKSALGDRKGLIAHTVPLTAGEAEAYADAAFRIFARRFITGRGVADANARLRVGSYVDLSGLGPLFSGKYYLVEVHHLFDSAGGFRTEFTAERAGIGKAQ